jgi:hypothetical protein
MNRKGSISGFQGDKPLSAMTMHGKDLEGRAMPMKKSPLVQKQTLSTELANCNNQWHMHKGPWKYS